MKPHGPPDALPAILFFVLPLIFAIGVTPLLASNYNPQVNAGRLEIRVASFDNGPIGSAFMSFVASTKGAVAGLPGLNVVDASTTSPEALRQAVRDSEVWGAIWVEADSSARLTSALTTPNNPYISTALHFAWDEGRNPLVTTARVGAPIKGYLAGFTASFASSFARSVSNATVLDVVRTNSQLLTAPVTVKEESLFPAADKPVTGVGLSIGNILIAVFALAITNAVLMGLAPVFARWGFRGTKMIAARTAVILAYTAIISATMATMLITLAGMNSHGDAWARTWATFWVMQASFVFYLSACAMWKGPAVLPLFFLFLLLANIIGGWNTDLADGGYMAFSCTSMYHALSLLRYVSETARCRSPCPQSSAGRLSHSPDLRPHLPVLPTRR